MSADGAEIALVPGAAFREVSLNAFVRALHRFIPALVGLGVFAVGAWAFRPYPVGIFHDDGVYLILARALAHSDGYRYLNIPDTPVATHYPPGYPVFLAALLALAPDFPRNLELLLLANAVLLGLVAWGVQRFAERRLGWARPAAALVAVVSTVSLPLLTLGGALMSEVLFLALLFPLLGATEEGAVGEISARSALALGAGAGALTLVRIFGVPIAIVLATVLAARRRWRLASCVIAGLGLVLIPWQLWVAMHGSGISQTIRGSYGSYLGWYADGLRAAGMRLVTGAARVNLGEIRWLLSDRFAPWPSALARLAGVIAVCAFGILGLIRSWRRAPVLAGFTVACLAITVVFPSTPWRYFWALWPMLLLLIGSGVEGVWRWVPQRAPLLGRLVAGAALFLLAAGVVRAETGAYHARAWAQPARVATAQIGPLVRWVARSTRPEDTVLADDEPLVFLYTGRQALPPVPSTAAEYVVPRSAARDVAALRLVLAQYPVRYVVTVVPWTYGLLRQLAGGAHPFLRALDPLPNGGAFEVLRP